MTARRVARIPLNQLAKINPHVSGASYIYRENNRRYIPIKFSVREPRPGLGHRLRRRSWSTTPRGRSPSLPDGYTIEWSGEFAQMQEANARLMWIVPLSIGLIMALLYTAFNVAQGRAAGDGQRGGRDDGRDLGAPDGPHTPFSNLGGGGVHLDLWPWRCRTGSS